MSDETQDTPSEATPPETPAVTPPAAASPAGPAAEAPAGPGGPAVEGPTETIAPTAAPAAVGAPTAPAAPAPAPAATEPAASGRKTVAIPMSVLIALAVLIGAAVMFGIGYAVGDSGGNNTQAISTPANRNPFNQQGNGNGNQQTPTLPRNPFNQPGNGNGNGNQQTPGQNTSGAFLGVATQQASNGGGVEITQVVSGSAAASAGLQTGDVITSFDGQRVSTPAELGAAVANTSPGDKVQVTYTRNGQTTTVSVTMGSRSSSN